MHSFGHVSKGTGIHQHAQHESHQAWEPAKNSLHVLVHTEDDVRHVVKLRGGLQHALSLISKKGLVIVACMSTNQPHFVYCRAGCAVRLSSGRAQQHTIEYICPCTSLQPSAQKFQTALRWLLHMSQIFLGQELLKQFLLYTQVYPLSCLCLKLNTRQDRLEQSICERCPVMYPILLLSIIAGQSPSILHSSSAFMKSTDCMKILEQSCGDPTWFELVRSRQELASWHG